MVKEHKGGKAPGIAARNGKRPAPSHAEAAAKKTKYDKGAKPTKQYEQPAVHMSKKERKQLSRERKARTNKNFNLIQEVIGLWETLRRHDTPAERQSELVSKILKKIDGRVGELAGSHSASRVVQACIKHGTPEERTKVLKQLEPKLLELAKGPYGRFVVSKLIDLSPKENLQVFLRAFKGHASELLRHPAGTHVLDDLYTAISAAQRNAIAAEFYGREYSLFQGGTLNNTEGAPASLQELLEAVDAPKRRSIIQHLAGAISPVIEKGLVDCQLAHRLIAEYLAAAPASLVADAVESLSGDALLHMLHTHHGATASCMVLAYGTAKDRKKAIRSLKGHVPAALQDEWGHLPIITALTVVDDTAMLKKFVVADIQKDLGDLLSHKAAHRVLLQLLHPDSSRYLPPTLATMVKPPEKIMQSSTKPGAEADEAAPSGSEDSESEDEGDEEAGNKTPAAGPLGVSKKDPLLRRKELLDGGLGKDLVALCAASGAELLGAQHAGDVVVEVCRGSEDGVLEDVVGTAEIDAVHAAIIDAAAAGNDAEDGGLLGSYFGSRAVRRLVLGAADDGAAGKTAARFVEQLWSKALKGRCKSLRETHAAKVLAAVLHSGCTAAVMGATAELKKAGTKDPQAWANNFLQKAH